MRAAASNSHRHRVANEADGSKPYIVEDRPMISRSSGDRIKITHTITPGQEETSCITCFYAPSNFPFLAQCWCCCPCFDYPEYIVNEIKGSRYIYIRENSIEYNQPTPQPQLASHALSTFFCCGHSPTLLRVKDNISIIYFDDAIMDTVINDTRICHELQSFCRGGRGERVRMEARFCGDWCIRGQFSCGCCVPCVPVGCPDCLCPFAARKTLFVEDAETAVKIIIGARDDAVRRLGMER